MRLPKDEFDRNLCCTLRTVATTNRFLMSQADKKADILIQVNGLLTIVLLTLTVYIAPHNRWFLLPIGIQLTSSVIVIAASLVVARPRFFISNVITPLVHSQESGNSLSNAGPLLYWHLLRDIHHQATILAVKFKWLRVSYAAFLCGLSLSLTVTIVVVIVAR